PAANFPWEGGVSLSSAKVPASRSAATERSTRDSLFHHVSRFDSHRFCRFALASLPFVSFEGRTRRSSDLGAPVGQPEGTIPYRSSRRIRTHHVPLQSH